MLPDTKIRSLVRAHGIQFEGQLYILVPVQLGLACRQGVAFLILRQGNFQLPAGLDGDLLNSGGQVVLRLCQTDFIGDSRGKRHKGLTLGRRYRFKGRLALHPHFITLCGGQQLHAAVALAGDGFVDHRNVGGLGGLLNRDCQAQTGCGVVGFSCPSRIQDVGTSVYRIRAWFQPGIITCLPMVAERTVRVIGGEVLGLGGGNRVAVGKLGGIVLVYQSAQSLGHGDLNVLTQGVVAHGDGNPVGMLARVHARRQGEAGTDFLREGLDSAVGLYLSPGVAGSSALALRGGSGQGHGLALAVGDALLVGGEGHALDGDFLHSYFFQGSTRGRLCGGNPGLPVSPEVGTALGQQVCYGAAFNCHLFEEDAFGGIGNGHLCAVLHGQLVHKGPAVSAVYDLQIASRGAYQLARQILVVQIQGAAYRILVGIAQVYMRQQLQCAALAIANLAECRLEIGIAGGHAVLGHGGHKACSVAVGAAAGAIQASVGAGFDGQVVKRIVRLADGMVIGQIFAAALGRIAGFQQAPQGHLEALEAVQPKLADGAALEQDGALVVAAPIADIQLTQMAVPGGADEVAGILKVDKRYRSRPAAHIQLTAVNGLHVESNLAGAGDDELCLSPVAGIALHLDGLPARPGNIVVVQVQGDFFAVFDVCAILQRHIAQQLHGGAVLGVIQGGGQVGGVADIAVRSLHHDGHGQAADTAGVNAAIYRYVLVGAGIAADGALAVFVTLVGANLAAQIAHAVRPMLMGADIAAVAHAVLIKAIVGMLHHINRSIVIRLLGPIDIEQRLIILIGEGTARGQQVRQGSAVAVQCPVPSAIFGVLESAAADLDGAIAAFRPRHIGGVGAALDGQAALGPHVDTYGRSPYIAKTAGGANAVCQRHLGCTRNDQKIVTHFTGNGMAVPVNGEGAAVNVELILPCQGHVPEEGEGGAGGSLCRLKGIGEVGEILFPRFCGKGRRRGIPAGAMAAAIQSVLWVGSHVDLPAHEPVGVRGIHDFVGAVVEGKAILQKLQGPFDAITVQPLFEVSALQVGGAVEDNWQLKARLLSLYGQLKLVANDRILIANILQNQLSSGSGVNFSQGAVFQGEGAIGEISHSQQPHRVLLQVQGHVLAAHIGAGHVNGFVRHVSREIEVPAAVHKVADIGFVLFCICNQVVEAVLSDNQGIPIAAFLLAALETDALMIDFFVGAAAEPEGNRVRIQAVAVVGQGAVDPDGLQPGLARVLGQHSQLNQINQRHDLIGVSRYRCAVCPLPLEGDGAGVAIRQVGGHGDRPGLRIRADRIHRPLVNADGRAGDGNHDGPAGPTGADLQAIGPRLYGFVCRDGKGLAVGRGRCRQAGMGAGPLQRQSRQVHIPAG